MLGPCMVNPTHLRDLRIQVESSYIASRSVKGLMALLQDFMVHYVHQWNKIVTLVSLLLLDGVNSFEVFKIVNLPVTSPDEEREERAVVNYRLEANNIAINLPDIKFIWLDPENTLAGCVNILKVCWYEMSVMELFKGYVDIQLVDMR